jgi:MFS family permease
MDKQVPQTALGELGQGWPVLAGATLGLAIGPTALQFYTAGLFVGRYEDAFGWTRSELSLISLFGTLGLAVFAPVAGAFMDRFGVRLAAMIGYVWLALSFWLCSRMEGSLAVYAAIQVGGVLFLAGATPIGLTRPVNAAFDKMRGLALGIAIGGIGATAFIAPPLVAHLIETVGWRVAFERLALFVFCLAPLVLLLLGVKGGGKPAQAPAKTMVRQPIPYRDPIFVRLFVCFLAVSLSVSGFVFHFVPMLTDKGVPLEQAAATQSLLGFAVLFGRIGAGAALDRFFAPRVATVMLLVTAASMVVLAIGGPQYAAVAAFGIGFALGAEVDLIAYMTARYFGMASYGRVYGLLYGAFLIGIGLSPLVIAQIHAAADSYAPALLGAGGLLVAAAALFLLAPAFPSLETTGENVRARAS